MLVGLIALVVVLWGGRALYFYGYDRGVADAEIACIQVLEEEARCQGKF